MSLGLDAHLTSLADPVIPVIVRQRQRDKPGIAAATDGQADKLTAARLEGNRGARGTAR